MRLLPLSLLAVLLLPLAHADTPPPSTAEATTSAPKSLLDLLRAAWTASTDAERAAREAADDVTMDGIRAGMAGNAGTSEEKVALLILMARHGRYAALEAVLKDSNNAESELKKARRLHEQLRTSYPDSPQRYELACGEWLIAMLEADLDAAQGAAERALAVAADPAEGALARLLGAEVLAARGELEAARALYAEAAAVPSAVPALIGYRLAALGTTPPRAQPSSGPAPDWLLGAEQKILEGRIP